MCILGMQDYNYVETNCFELTLELGCRKYPPAKDLPKYWEENKEALLNFLLQVSSNINVAFVTNLYTSTKIVGLFQVHAGIKGVVFGFQGGEVAALPDAVIMVMNITDPTHPHLIDHAISTSKIEPLSTLILIIFQ